VITTYPLSDQISVTESQNSAKKALIIGALNAVGPLLKGRYFNLKSVKGKGILIKMFQFVQKYTNLLILLANNITIQSLD